jgi:hypothetical protein
LVGIVISAEVYSRHQKDGMTTGVVGEIVCWCDFNHSFWLGQPLAQGGVVDILN